MFVVPEEMVLDPSAPVPLYGEITEEVAMLILSPYPFQAPTQASKSPLSNPS
jgi:hypothetical protein